MIFGALWGVIPGYLKAKLGVNEIISTLMLNYIAIAWNNFFLFGMWSDKGFQMSKKFPQEALLTRLSDIAKTYDIKALRGMALHLGLVFALIAAIVALFAGIAFVIGVDGLAESIHDAIKNDEITLEDIENMMSALGVLLVAFGIVGIIIGYGLLKGWTWMWYLAVILYGIGLILSFIALVGSHTLSNVVTLVIVIYALIVTCALQRDQTAAAYHA